jgi:hypothetical protein
VRAADDVCPRRPLRPLTSIARSPTDASDHAQPPEAHRSGLERIVQAGAQPVSRVSLACELQRGWPRRGTVPEVVDIVLTSRLLKEADQASS